MKALLHYSGECITVVDLSTVCEPLSESSSGSSNDN